MKNRLREIELSETIQQLVEKLKQELKFPAL